MFVANQIKLFSVELTGYYNDAVFDHRELDFVLGEGETCGIIDGLEIALKKFKKGEKSRLKFKPKYAYGSKGWPEKNIPPHAEVSYDVTLKEFEKVSRSVIKRINTLSEIYYVVQQKCLCKTISI